MLALFLMIMVAGLVWATLYRPHPPSSTFSSLPSSPDLPKPLSLQITSIPVFIHFLAHPAITNEAKEPAFRTNGHIETMRDVDTAIEAFNKKVAEAAGTDPRRIELVKVGSRVITSQEPCPDPLTIIPEHRVPDVINVLFQSGDGCVPVSNPSIYLRTEAGAFAHEMGHTLGLKHTFFANDVPGQAELLARIKDPNDPQSCYLLGDNVCDTPPDYGYRYLLANGTSDDTRVVCSQAPFPACVQDGPACDLEDVVIDTRQTSQKLSVCTSLSSTQGRRTYDPVALGLVARQGTDGVLLPNGNNVMAYMDQTRFTYEQFLRMYGFTQWRLGHPERIPLSEQRILRGMESGPEDPFGTVGKPTTAEGGWRLREALAQEEMK